VAFVSIIRLHHAFELFALFSFDSSPLPILVSL
jgi:hypothetical protein